MSAAICNVVILAGGTRKSALQLLHSSPGPICHADCVPVSTREAVIYSLLSPAMRAADELGIEPEDGHFSSLTGWTSAAGWISLRARLMDSLGQNRDKLSAFHFLLGRNKTDVRPSEKDSITDITSGGGGETRAGNEVGTNKLFIICLETGHFVTTIFFLALTDSASSTAAALDDTSNCSGTQFLENPSLLTLN